MNIISVIYQDNNIIAVNKPPGIEAHEIAAHFPGAQLAHRLDRDTSGILLLAKHERAYKYLKGLFQERKIKKTYIALVEGIVRQKQGVIDLPIARSRRHPSRRVAGAGARGKTREARTRFVVEKIFSRDQYTLLTLFPESGRTHQIRVHLKAIGHAVACDKLYLAKRPCPGGLGRQFLHAFALEFALPLASPSLGGSGGHIQLEAEIPEDLQTALHELT